MKLTIEFEDIHGSQRPVCRVKVGDQLVGFATELQVGVTASNPLPTVTFSGMYRNLDGLAPAVRQNLERYIELLKSVPYVQLV